MKKLKEEVLVEVYVEYKGSTYVRGMEYTVDEDNDSIEWHEVGYDGDWSFVRDIELYKELERVYISTFVNA